MADFILLLLAKIRFYVQFEPVSRGEQKPPFPVLESLVMLVSRLRSCCLKDRFFEAMREAYWAERLTVRLWMR